MDLPWAVRTMAVVLALTLGTGGGLPTLCQGLHWTALAGA